MLRFSFLIRLSHNPLQSGGGGAGGSSWSPHHRKQMFRQGKHDLQRTRQRQHVQRDRFELQQSVNLAHGELSRERARQQRDLQAAAMHLAYGGGGGSRKATTNNGRAPPRVTASERAAELATARQYLQLAEASRKHNKKGRFHRTEEFRAAKRWR